MESFLNTSAHVGVEDEKDLLVAKVSIYFKNLYSFDSKSLLRLQSLETDWNYDIAPRYQVFKRFFSSWSIPANISLSAQTRGELAAFTINRRAGQLIMNATNSP